LARVGGTADASPGQALGFASRADHEERHSRRLFIETQRTNARPREAKPSTCLGEALAVPPSRAHPPTHTHLPRCKALEQRNAAADVHHPVHRTARDRQLGHAGGPALASWLCVRAIHASTEHFNVPWGRSRGAKGRVGAAVQCRHAVDAVSGGKAGRCGASHMAFVVGRGTTRGCKPGAQGLVLRSCAHAARPGDGDGDDNSGWLWTGASTTQRAAHARVVWYGVCVACGWVGDVGG
jgi:hypothetical protein